MSIDRESIKDRLRPGTGEPDDGYISDTDFFGVIDDLADGIDGVADGTLLGPDSVTQGNLAPNSVGASEIKTDAVGGDEIAPEAIGAKHVADGALPVAKISGLAAVATSGSYSDLSDRPNLGTAAAADTNAFATSAQGALADSAIQPAIADAKGDLIVGTGPDAVARLAVGANGTVPFADSAQPAGMRWKLLDIADIDPDRVTFSDANFTIPAAARMVAQTGTMTAPRTVTLPAAGTVAAGQVVTVKDASGTVTGTNTITVVRAGSNTINGATAGIVINTAYSARQFASNGADGWTAIITPAQVTYGDQANTAAQGNDPRIVGAASAATIGNLLPASIATAESLTGASGSGGTLALSSAAFEVGAQSWLLTQTTTANPAAFYGGGAVSPNAQAIPVVGGQVYTLIFSVRSVGHTTPARALLYSWDAPGVRQDNAVIIGSAVATVDGVWQRRAVTFRPAATANRIAFAIGLQGASAGQAVHIDRLGVWRGAGGEWAPPGVPITGLGFRADPTNPAQVQVHVPGTANTWVTV